LQVFLLVIVPLLIIAAITDTNPVGVAGRISHQIQREFVKGWNSLDSTKVQ